MKIFIFESELQLARPVSEVFPFFADARNLQALTPDWLNFESDPLGWFIHKDPEDEFADDI